MSMSDQRDRGVVPEAGISSSKLALGVTGTVIGLALLTCGGLAGYVAWTGSSGEPRNVLVAPKERRSEIQTISDEMVLIDLPTGFEPMEYEMPIPMTCVTFRRKSGEAAILIVGKVGHASVDRHSSLEMQREMLLEQLDLGKDNSRQFSPTADSTVTKRELTVLGQRTVFEITHGTLNSSAIPVARVVGFFRTQKARIVIVYVIPEAEYDEDAIVRMIESIRPAQGDSAPESSNAENPSPEDPSAGSASERSKADPADDDTRGRRQESRPDDH